MRARVQKVQRRQMAQIADAAPRKERDVDREVEQHGPARDEPQKISEPAHDKILTAACHRVGRGEFGVGKSDANVRRPPGHADDQAECDKDVGADVGVPPGVRTPRSYRAA